MVAGRDAEHSDHVEHGTQDQRSRGHTGPQRTQARDVDEDEQRRFRIENVFVRPHAEGPIVC